MFLFVIVDGKPAGLPLSARGSLERAMLHSLLAPAPTARHHLYTAPNTGNVEAEVEAGRAMKKILKSKIYFFMKPFIVSYTTKKKY